MVASYDGMLMDQKIFELGLAVEVVSVYLLCVGLAESGTELTFKNMTSVWNGAEEGLLAGINELERLNIVEKDSENNSIKHLFNSAMWNANQ